MGVRIRPPASRGATRNSRAPSATWSPTPAPTSVTVPANGALSASSIFIASSAPSTSPSATAWPSSTRTSSTVPGIGARIAPSLTSRAWSPKTSGRSKTWRWPWCTTSTLWAPTLTTARCRAPSMPSTDRVVLGGELLHGGLLDQAARPVHQHRPVELDHHRGRLGAQPPAVGAERVPAAGVLGPDERRGPRRDHPGGPRRRLGDRVPVQPRGVDRGVAELLARGQRAQEPGVGGQAQDRGVVEGGDQRLAGRLAVGAAGDHLAEHRVVRRADDLAALQRLVHPGPGRPAHQHGRAGLGQEAVEGVLGVDPGLDGVPGQAEVGLAERQRLAGGDAQLQLRPGRRARRRTPRPPRSPGARPGGGCSSPGSRPRRWPRRAGTPRCRRSRSPPRRPARRPPR